MAGIPEIAQLMATASGATGVSVAPALHAAITSFWRNDTKRNLLRGVRNRLLDDRPEPGDTGSLVAIYHQLCDFLVDPGFLDAMNAYAERGSLDALDAVRAHIGDHLVVPEGANRSVLLNLIGTALMDGLAAAHTSPQSATGAVSRLHSDRLAVQMEEMQAQLTSIDARLAPPPLLILEDFASWTRKTMRVVVKEDPAGYTWLTAQLGDPPSSERIVATIDRWPAELESGSTHLLYAAVRHAEAVGAWTQATSVWEHLAERSEASDRADHYARAAVDAGMAGDIPRRQGLLAAAFEADPSSVRAALEAVDDALEPEAKLKALEPLRTDDAALACLLECYRSREYLVLDRLEQAEEHLTKARQLSPNEVSVRQTEVNLAVQRARRALRERQPSSAEQLRTAQSAALALREELLPMGRYDETVRLLMLAAEADGFLFDFPAMAQRLSTALPEEIGSSDGPPVLADAALRADDRDLARAFAAARPGDPTCQRVRVALDASDPDAPNRADALHQLAAIALADNGESTLAALARLQGGAVRPQFEWDARVADVLVRNGHESVAVGLHVETLLRADRAIAAGMLLDDLPDEAWVTELRVRVSGNPQTDRGVDRGRAGIATPRPWSYGTAARGAGVQAGRFARPRARRIRSGRP